MPADPQTELAAAVLTLSEGIDALHRVLRQTLSLLAEQQGQKIPESFVPKLIDDTAARRDQWRKELAE